jgi:hypothetical protein
MKEGVIKDRNTPGHENMSSIEVEGQLLRRETSPLRRQKKQGGSGVYRIGKQDSCIRYKFPNKQDEIIMGVILGKYTYYTANNLNFLGSMRYPVQMVASMNIHP